jgi:cellulose synthase/poly-beta-1,6-N-acetylglucosamine synthase-like glycosyltransferase
MTIPADKLRAMNVFALLTIGVVVALYAWTVYNLPTLVAGLRRTVRRQGSRAVEHVGLSKRISPTFSITVAARNEERVIGRLLDRLRALDYSKNLYEVIVVEDGSTDATRQICERYAEQNPQLIRFFHSEDSRGKPHALNRALAECRGEIVAVLDADSFPNLDLLSQAAGYFEDSSLAAIQGMTLPINRDESMISKLSAYEEAAWFKVYLRGKEDLGLFIPLTGSCAFIRRHVVQELGGWDENSLAEDVELAARLVDNGQRIRYAPDVQSLQEYPASAKQLFDQRTRWFRGYMETWVKYGKLIGKPSRLSMDVEATLFGPYVLNLILLSYIMAFSGLFVYNPAASIWLEVIATSAAGLTVVTLFLCGFALVWHLRPHRLRNIIWIPAVFLFWLLQTIIAFHALVLTVLRRNRSWVKTEKSGEVSLTH